MTVLVTDYLNKHGDKFRSFDINKYQAEKTLAANLLVRTGRFSLFI